MSEVALGIDVGTSGVRVAAVDAGGRTLAMAQQAIAAPMQSFGRILQDPLIWWDAAAGALEALAAQIKQHRVRAISIDGTSGTIVPIARDGMPVGLASMYNDLAERADVARITEVSPVETAARGGTSALARALPMRGVQGVERILHQADWLAGQLSGRFEVTDENNALKSGYDPVQRIWPAWISKTGFDVALYPSVVPAGTRTGSIGSEAARQFGLPEDVAIVAGTTDGCAAFLASGADQPGDGVTSLGTTLTLKLLSTKPVFASKYGIYSHRIGDDWLAGGASNSGGQALAVHFSKQDIERLSASIDPDTPTSLDYYPLPNPGERFPIADPELAPRIEPRPEEERVFLQALLEGVAAVEALGYRRLAELGATPLSTIRTVGGGAANDKWTAIRLKKLCVPARAPLSEHACVGTARLAWRGIGHAH